MLHHRSNLCGVLEDKGVVSNQFFTVINRLFTAAMLVAMLIACQEMPESTNFGDVEVEYLDK